jgi:hypothetical protein
MTLLDALLSNQQRTVEAAAISLPRPILPGQPSRRFISAPALAILAVFGVITALCLITIEYGIGVLRILYPVAAVFIGLALYFLSQTGYLTFTFVVWFISPLVRRLIDLNAGWVDPSPVLLAPLLVTLISGLSLPLLFRVGSKSRCPFLLALAALLYGLGVSLLRPDSAGVTVPLLNFLAPILFGAHIMSNWRHRDQLGEAFDRTMVAAVVAMGLYGILQFQLAPAWDTNWMINVDSEASATFGTAEPLGIRVFSTLNSPIPFGNVMMAGLLILTNRRGWAGALLACIGYVAFGLSLARTAWLGWAAGALLLIISSQLARLRLIFGLALGLAVVIALSSDNPIADVVSKRVQSLVAPKGDFSFNVRLTAYEQYVGALLAEPFGQGVANRGYDINTRVGFGPHDSAVLEILRCLGWFGGGSYLLAVIMLIYQASVSLKHDTLRLQSYRAIAFGVIPAALFASVFLSVSGVVFWTILSLASAHRIQSTERSSPSKPIEPCGVAFS